MKLVIKYSFCILAVLILAGCATPPPPVEIEEPVEVPVVIAEPPVEVPPVEIPPPPPVVEPEPPVVEPPEPPTVEPPEPPTVEPPPVVEVVREPVRERISLVMTSGLESGYPVVPALRGTITAPMLLVDRGNTFSSFPFANIDEGESIITLMNALTYDAMALGTDDFAHDATRLLHLARMSGFPFIGSNIRGDDEISSSVILNAGDISVALVSVINPLSFDEMHISRRSGFTAEDPVESVQRLIEELHADIIIMFTDFDILSYPVTDEQLPSALEILDAVSLVVQRPPAEPGPLAGFWLIGTEAPLVTVTLNLEDRIISSMEIDDADPFLLEPDSYISSLEKAARESQQQVIDRALNYITGNTINSLDRYGLTPLMNALQFDEDTQVVGVLLSEGASVDKRDEYGMSSLMYAAWLNSSPRVITRLLRAGASVDEIDSEGWTPLMRAVLNENIEILQVIIETGADIEAVNNEGWTALMFAAGFGTDARFAKILIESGADLDRQSDEGMTALMYAAGFNSDPDIISLLLDAGADTMLMDEFGSTALDYAKQNRNIRGSAVMEKLIEASAY